MTIELEQSFQNRTGRRNNKSGRGHETAQDEDILVLQQHVYLLLTKTFLIPQTFTDGLKLNNSND